MMVKGFWWSTALLAVSGTAAVAQDWSAVDANGVREASVENNGAAIRFDCSTSDLTVPNAITLTVGDAAINGPVTFSFDNGTSVAGIFANNTLVADTAENGAVFSLVRDLMRSQNGVNVAARNVPEQAFALRGSGRAIGACEVDEASFATAPEARPEEPAEPDVVSETPVADEPSDTADLTLPTRPAPIIPDGLGTLTAPVEGHPFADYRLADCGGVRGLMLMNYDTLNGVTELSDFCFDAETGTLDSSEPRAGFSAAEDGTFEVVESGDTRVSRVRIELADDLRCGGMLDAQTVNYVIPDGTLSRNPETLFLFARGITVPDGAGGTALFETEETLLSIRDFSVRRIAPATTETSRLPAGADLRGVLSGSGAAGSLDITNGNGFWVGEAGGGVTFTVDDAGSVIGSGQFDAQNRKLVGQDRNDWVTMSAEIPYLRGYVLGESGDALIAYGVVRGSYVDGRDDTHQFEASATFTACGTP